MGGKSGATLLFSVQAGSCLVALLPQLFPPHKRAVPHQNKAPAHVIC